MRIGFDIDGVVAKQDLATLRMIDLYKDKKKKKECFKYYYLLREIDLNPLLFLHDDDKLYFITGRNKRYKDVTVSWINRFFPNSTIVILNQPEPKKETIIEDWFKTQARLKASALIQNKIEVYFEDVPEVVSELRKLVPGCKIIQYGARRYDKDII